MSQPKPTDYLESKLKTASSAQIHLMLIEGAVRFCTKAELELEKSNETLANESMVRAIDIVGEMLAGVGAGQSEINHKLRDLYQYLLGTLTSAYVNTDRAKLADVLRILQFERETWRLACQRVSDDGKPSTPAEGKPTIIAPQTNVPMPAEGFSLEA